MMVEQAAKHFESTEELAYNHIFAEFQRKLHSMEQDILSMYRGLSTMKVLQHKIDQQKHGAMLKEIQRLTAELAKQIEPKVSASEAIRGSWKESPTARSAAARRGHETRKRIAAEKAARKAQKTGSWKPQLQNNSKQQNQSV